MNLFKKIFGSNRPQKECPRCLGKGHVDAADIKRLNKELRWLPGPCAYCNGTGKIDPQMEEEVPVDTAYLTTDIGPGERDKIIKGDTAAWERADHFDKWVEDFITQVSYLHFNAGLNADQITGFFMLNHHNQSNYETAKQELYDYVNKIIRDK
jgi:hypothetical protein